MTGSQVKEDAGTAAVETSAPPRLPAAGPLPLQRERLLRVLRDDRVRVPLVLFFLSRAYVFLLGAIAMHIGVGLPPVPALDYFMPELQGLAHYLLQPWRNWDGHWYALIAREGYLYDISVTAFYPLYPLLLRWGAWLLGGRLELAGVLISNLCFLGALVVLYRLIELDFSAPLARRTLIYLALFPTSFYFSAVYNESLFLLLAVACFYAARRDRWWLAGAFGFLAALTRIHGMLLLVPLVILFLRQQGWRPWWRWLLSLLLMFGVLPALLLDFYLYRATGHPAPIPGLQRLSLVARTEAHALILLVPPLLLGASIGLALWQRDFPPWRWHLNLVSLTLVPAGLMVYMAYLRRLWDDPLVMVRAQKGWDRYSATPLETLREGIEQVDSCAVQNWNVGVDTCWVTQFIQQPGLATIRDFNWRWGFSESDVMELVATIFLVVLGLAAFRLLPLAYSAYLAAGIVLPLWSPSIVHPLMSMHRFALILFPAFVVLALLGRWRVVHAVIVVVSALLLAFFINQFASWLWVA